MERLQLRQAMMAERRHEMLPDDLGIALEGFPGDVGLRVVVEPTLQVFADRRSRWFDVLAGSKLIKQLGAFVFSLPLATANRVPLVSPLPAVVLADVDRDRPRVLASL